MAPVFVFETHEIHLWGDFVLKTYKYIPSTIKTPQRLNMKLSGVCLGLRNVLILMRMKNSGGGGRYDVLMMSMESQGLYGGWWLRVQKV